MSEDIQAEHYVIENTAKRLLEHGRAVGPFMPWHHSKDLYHWVIAESLLRRTTRTAACRAFNNLISSYSTWSELAAAPQEQIAERIACAGLANQRSQQLKTMASIVTVEFGDTTTLCERDDLLSLPGVGDYISDAVLLHVCGVRVFPIDKNVQRVARRVIGLPVSEGSRYSDPYRDPASREFARHVILQHTADELADIHRGVLHIAWESCRPRSNCLLCVIKSVCVHASQEEIPRC